MKVSENQLCSGCPMLKVSCDYEKAGKKVHHEGSEQTFVPPTMGPSLRLLLGRDPGEQESLEGKPFVGAAGKFLDSLLRKAGVQRDTLTVLNCRQCRPPNNIDPLSSQARFYISEADARRATDQCWKHHVEPVLTSRPWERIDALGGEALEALTGVKGGILTWRGSPLPLKGEVKPKVIGTLHPSYIMVYGQSMIPAVVSDLKKGVQLPPEHYNLTPTLDDVAAFRSTKFTFDIETNGFTKQITMVGLSDRPYHCVVVPFRGAYIAELKRIFANAEQVIGHNIISFDLPVLEVSGVTIKEECQVWDTILMHHLISPDSDHDLGYVGSIFTQKPYHKNQASKNMILYCARDVDMTLQCFNGMYPILAQQNLLDLYRDIQVPLAKICHLMEETGIHSSGARAQAVRERLLKELIEQETLLPAELQPYDKSIRVRQPAPPGTLGKAGKPVKYIHVAGTERVIPWRSPDRLADYLYVKLELPKQYNAKAKTKEPTTNKLALEKLQNYCIKHDRPDDAKTISALRRISGIDQLATSFIKGMKDEDGKEIPIKDAHIFPHFSPYGTSQGRLSSSGPNFQNQPPTARYIYVPSNPEWCLIEADYSQGENKLTAYYANDLERLQRLSVPGFSEHKLNAEIFFGVPYDEVVKDNSPDAPYGRAKKLTHGINYGEGPRKIAMSLDLPEKDVRDWLFKWRERNQPTVRFQEEVSSKAARDGVLTNVFGRKRWFWCVAPETRTLTTDLTWVSVGSLKVGDKLVGFDEDLTAPCYRESEVTHTEVIQAPRYKVVTDKGTVIATPNHKWATRLQNHGYYSHRWLTTESLTVGDTIVWMCKPWETENSRESGWLAGILDGEGHISNFQRVNGKGQGRGTVNITQKTGLVLDKVLALCAQFQINTTEPRPTGNLTTPDGRLRNVMATRLTVDSPRSALEVIGRFQPTRLKQNARQLWEGKPVYNNQNLRDEVATVLSIEQIEDGPVVMLSTSTKTLVTDGLLSHNTDRLYGESLSFLPQSTLADIIHRAGIGMMYERIGWSAEKALRASEVLAPLPWPARLLAQVHDSFLIEAPKDLVPEVVKCLTAVMQQPWPQLGGYNLTAEFEVSPPGASWGEKKSYKLEEV